MLHLKTRDRRLRVYIIVLKQLPVRRILIGQARLYIVVVFVQRTIFLNVAVHNGVFRHDPTGPTVVPIISRATNFPSRSCRTDAPLSAKCS